MVGKSGDGNYLVDIVTDRNVVIEPVARDVDVTKVDFGRIAEG